ncbi:hypothetical protein G5714_010733 [Onychostoma macrolepis]|nr:hypothetical protein G5714_010733 [Onychostoma macrolepis]
MLVPQNPRPVTQGPLPAPPPPLRCLAQAPKTLRRAGWLIFEELPLRASLQAKCLYAATKHQLFSLSVKRITGTARRTNSSGQASVFESLLPVQTSRSPLPNKPPRDARDAFPESLSPKLVLVQSSREYIPVLETVKAAESIMSQADISTCSAPQRVFQEAVKKGNTKELHSLLQNMTNCEFNVNSFGPEGQTALHQSVIDGNLELVKLLVKFGADIRLANREGWSALHIAAFGGHQDIVLYLITKAKYSSGAR